MQVHTTGWYRLLGIGGNVAGQSTLDRTSPVEVESFYAVSPLRCSTGSWTTGVVCTTNTGVVYTFGGAGRGLGFLNGRTETPQRMLGVNDISQCSMGTHITVSDCVLDYGSY